MNKYHCITGLKRYTNNSEVINLSENARSFIFVNDSNNQIKVELEDSAGNTQEYNFNPVEDFNFDKTVIQTLAFNKATITSSASSNFRFGAIVEVK
jgi:hypothetical protein